MIKIARKKNIYEIPNCTLNQLIKYLRAVREGGKDYEIKKSLVGDRDPHHQRNMARRLKLIEEDTDNFTEIGKNFLDSFEKGEEYKNIFRKCLINDPYFNTMFKTININSPIKKQDLKRSIKNLIGERSSSTLQVYANLTVNYLEFGGLIEYDKRTKMIKILE